MDTVHQGDQDGQKGVYHINAVDEVTQWEVVASVEKIAESYLRPGITPAKLDDSAHEMSDNEFTERMVKAGSHLFQNISRWGEPVVRDYPLTQRTANLQEKGSNQQQSMRSHTTTSPGPFFD